MALTQRTLDLVNIASESRSEAEVYDYVLSAVPLEQAYSDGESVLFAKREGKPLVLLAGHTDTVPAQGNLPGRIEDVELSADELKNGRVEQDNFNGYRVLRINEMPKVEVHIVPSAEAPTGVGEPGVAPIGPAVANAIFAATGKRVHLLPFPKPGKT